MLKDYCYACHREMPKKHPQHFSKGLLDTFIMFARSCAQQQSNSIHVKSAGPDHNRQANFQKLQYFGIIEKDKTQRGYWKITKKGIEFLRGETKIPKKVETLESVVVSTSEETVHIGNTNVEYREYWQQDFSM